jgi:SWI/SNF-related matrix-associated actin-dependent regulator of chromatin subfamily A3
VKQYLESTARWWNGAIGEICATAHGNSLMLLSNRGCVTPAILSQLATLNLNSVAGFQDLTLAIYLLHIIPANRLNSPQDQQKIHLAISLRRVDPADIPSTARSVQPTRVATKAKSNEKRKRKADEQISLSSTAASASQSVTPTLAQPSEEDMNEELAEEEVRDELYCTMHTNVVGIQYYQGWMYGLL